MTISFILIYPFYDITIPIMSGLKLNVHAFGKQGESLPPDVIVNTVFYTLLIQTGVIRYIFVMTKRCTSSSDTKCSIYICYTFGPKRKRK